MLTRKPRRLSSVAVQPDNSLSGREEVCPRNNEKYSPNLRFVIENNFWNLLDDEEPMISPPPSMGSYN